MRAGATVRANVLTIRTYLGLCLLCSICWTEHRSDHGQSGGPPPSGVIITPVVRSPNLSKYPKVETPDQLRKHYSEKFESYRQIQSKAAEHLKNLQAFNKEKKKIESDLSARRLPLSEKSTDLSIARSAGRISKEEYLKEITPIREQLKEIERAEKELVVREQEMQKKTVVLEQESKRFAIENETLIGLYRRSIFREFLGPEMPQLNSYRLPANDKTRELIRQIETKLGELPVAQDGASYASPQETFEERMPRNEDLPPEIREFDQYLILKYLNTKEGLGK